MITEEMIELFKKEKIAFLCASKEALFELNKHIPIPQADPLLYDRIIQAHPDIKKYGMVVGKGFTGADTSGIHHWERRGIKVIKYKPIVLNSIKLPKTIKNET